MSLPSFAYGSNSAAASSGFTCEVTDIFPSLNLLKKSTDEADKFAIDWILKSQNLNNMIKNHAEYEKHQKEYYDNFKNVQIDKTFENVDTSNRENFIESIKKQFDFVDNKDYFLKLLNQML